MGNFNGKSPQVLEAFLNLISHPAWIADTEGHVMLNRHAVDISRQGLKLDFTKDIANSTTIIVQGKNYRLNKRNMNYGTNCFLYELRLEDEYCRRLKESVGKLSAVLDARP